MATSGAAWFIREKGKCSTFSRNFDKQVWSMCSQICQDFGGTIINLYENVESLVVQKCAQVSQISFKKLQNEY